MRLDRHPIAFREVLDEEAIDVGIGLGVEGLEIREIEEPCHRIPSVPAVVQAGGENPPLRVAAEPHPSIAAAAGHDHRSIVRAVQHRRQRFDMREHVAVEQQGAIEAPSVELVERIPKRPLRGPDREWDGNDVETDMA